MIDTQELFSVFDLTCTRCGKPGADTFRDEAGLAALLGALKGGGGIRTIVRDDLQRFGPLHARCVKRGRGRPNLLRTISFG